MSLSSLYCYIVLEKKEPSESGQLKGIPNAVLNSLFSSLMNLSGGQNALI